MFLPHVWFLQHTLVGRRVQAEDGWSCLRCVTALAGRKTAFSKQNEPPGNKVDVKIMFHDSLTERERETETDNNKSAVLGQASV